MKRVYEPKKESPFIELPARGQAGDERDEDESDAPATEWLAIIGDLHRPSLPRDVPPEAGECWDVGGES